LALLLLLPCWVPPRTAQDELSIQTMNRGILWVVLCLNVVLMVITRNFSYSRDHFTTVLLILGLCLSVGAGIAFASSPECRTVSSLGLAIILLGIATPGFCVFLLRDISSELSYAVLIPVVIAVALIIIGLAVERAGRVLKARAANSNDAAKA
ncbi:MAG TPA: hypothetical protein VK970_05755, partial [Candidatus Methylacidiphilales bacterium]|nr:hypothetical protein [Candidatus Methylacidiphilales bacterium]